jgi:hypothetical protein
VAQDAVGRLRAAKVAVVGIVRDCGKTLEDSVLRISAAFAAADEVRWVIIESDSSDDTLEVLGRLKQRDSRFSFLSLGTLRNSIPDRIQRIAACRNAYLDELGRTDAYRDITHVVVADFDGVNNMLAEESVLSCFLRTDWDVCAANQAGPYYDVWALRHPLWCPADCWQQYRFLAACGVPDAKALYTGVHSKMITLSQSIPWIQVDSAFGGIAIYRREALDGCRYVALGPDGREICEHVTLHQQMLARGSKIFINPRLINTTYGEHTIGLRPTFRRRLRHAAKALLVALSGRDL